MKAKTNKSKSRIASILQANHLDSSITGLPTFDLSKLKLNSDPEFSLSTDLRLGHLAEKIVSKLIKSSANFKVLYENVQLIENNRTIGEIDFIIENILSNQVIHLELAYKFYLFDPDISSIPLNNWIGPNRNDSLKEKLDKLKSKQFPLLYHDCARSKFDSLKIDEADQALCLLVSLFVPYAYKASLSPVYEKAIEGYYLNFKEFKSFDHSDKAYYVPSKQEWGMDPSENENWTDFDGVKNYITISMQEQQAPLCWQKCNGSYSVFFIVWW